MLLLLPVILAAPSRLLAQGDLPDGDAAWRSRAEGHDRRGRARPEPIGRAIFAYERAREADPDDLAVHWKLIRALHFAGEFASRDEAQKRALFDRATDASERAFEAVARRLGDTDPLGAGAPGELAARIPEADRPDYVARHRDERIETRISVDDFVGWAKSCVERRVQIVGGCCGIELDYIKPLREALPSHLPAA